MGRPVRAAWMAMALVAASGCGDSGDESAPGTGGEAGGPPATCTLEDTFDAAYCPASYPDYQCEVFVDGDVASSGNGWSWDGAVKTVQEGIDRAHCGVLEAGVCADWQVWVKQGSYFVHQLCRLDFVRLRPHVEVYGGFFGNETSLYDRDWAANETILDGRDGPDGQNHVYHVVVGADDAVLDGFIVQRGRADHESEQLLQNGGGMGNVSVSPTVENCTFRDNFAVVAGAGMVNSGGSPTVSGCLFEGNEAQGNGGGIHNRDGSEPTIDDCRFIDNVAGSSGGGMKSADSSPTVSDCTFENNVAGGSGGGLDVSAGSVTLSGCLFEGNQAWHNGGGVRLSEVSSATLSDCTFRANNAGSHAGGLGVVFDGIVDVSDCRFESNSARMGGGIALWGGAGNLTLTGCTLEGNQALATAENDWAVGGGLHVNTGTATVVDSSVLDNSADHDGGGLHVAEADAAASVSGCTFGGNSASNAGGAIAVGAGFASVEGSDFNGNQALSTGGGISIYTGAAEVTASRFDGNSAESGGAIAVLQASAEIASSRFAGNSAESGGAIAVLQASAEIASSRFAGNSAIMLGGGLMMGGGATVSLTSSILFGNAAGYGGGIEAESAGALSLLHCTVAGNTATGSGGAIYGAADLTVTSSILWDPAASDEIAESGSTALSVSYSDVRGYSGGAANLDSDPLFVDLASGDLHLQGASSCIDAADPSSAPVTDIEGNPRVGDPDMGAYEHP